MKIFSVLSNKGGAGKTTLSTNLAAYASSKRKENVLLIDIDPQGSSINWSDLRESDNLEVLSSPVSRLKKIIDKAKELGVSQVFIDYPPHGDPGVATAARMSDLILIPCRTSSSDLAAMAGTIEIVNFTKLPAVVIFNAVRSRGSLEDEAKEALEPTGIDICPYSLGDRVAFIRAYADGLGATEYEPKGKASKEVSRIYRYIHGKLK